MSVSTGCLAQMLQNNFDIFEKKCDSIEDTQIFLLGRQPNNLEQRLKIGWFLSHAYKGDAGDVVIIESLEKNPGSSSEILFVNKKVSLKGWNSKLKIRKVKQQECLVEILLHIQSVRKYGIDENSLMSDIVFFKDKFPLPYAKYKTVINNICSEETLSKLNSPAECMKHFNEAVSKVKAAWLEYQQQECVDKNKRLISSIEEHIPQSRRIFVIADIEQLILDRKINLFEQTEEGVRLLHRYCSNKKFVVLYPNQKSLDLQNIQGDISVYGFNYTTIEKVVFVCNLIYLVVLVCFNFYTTKDQIFERIKLCESLEKLDSLQLASILFFASTHPEKLPKQIITMSEAD